jgi:hypothetical protein
VTLIVAPARAIYAPILPKKQADLNRLPQFAIIYQRDATISPVFCHLDPFECAKTHGEIKWLTKRITVIPTISINAC